MIEPGSCAGGVEITVHDTEPKVIELGRPGAGRVEITAYAPEPFSPLISTALRALNRRGEGRWFYPAPR